MTMKFGVFIPQGWRMDLVGIGPAEQWNVMSRLAQRAEAGPWESIWVYDHFHTTPVPTDEATHEAWSLMAAFAASTSRVRLGQMCTCMAYRNPAYLAKVAATIDVISGGRFELGIGAGWKEDEWRAYGYGFPTLRERMQAFRDHLEVVERMLAPGRASFEGEHASVRDAVNEPKGVQAHIPIIVGGNGQKVTFRLAARHADELNLVFLRPDEIAEVLPIARQRCEEVERDPASLRISLYVRDPDIRSVGQERVDRLGEYAALGLDRLIAFPGRYGPDAENQEAFAADCRSAGLLASG
jgi:F420-dependent oxidoreductase-like protein